jgi:hypothetical protein
MKRCVIVIVLLAAGLLIPVGNASAAGWHTIFYDNFVTAVPKGQFPGTVYGPRWRAWNTDRDGFGDIHKIAKYDAGKTASVGNGYLTIDLHTDSTGQAYSAAIMPERNGAHASQKYGRWVMRWKAVPYGAGAQGWGWASLLWPDSNVWADGEIDWPEIYGGTSPNVLGYNHCVAATGRPPSEKCGVNVNTFKPWLNTWHETSVVWSPGSLQLWMDGKQYGTASGVNVPTAVLHQVIQTGTASWTAPCPTCGVKLSIDFVKIDQYLA